MTMEQLLSIPGLVEVGAPALGAGILLGALLAWLFVRSRIHAYQAEIKSQQALQQEREIAFEAARSQLTAAFSDLANQSLRSNSPISNQAGSLWLAWSVSSQTVTCQ